ncbi:MAG: acetate--CoA ligase [Bacillota bacterium]|uniref:Acetyl-coenzyme A synthetase n=1 Tax=Thermanaerosceptrum fracticalcis TaxID=1712410 RepID=A0A7G6E6I9_THEFR|nr:acetate--CoA ligase [Thermanaerosceptrum fracticalcis]QNB47693.1 acetate--CoA ligase [Thermanaerosceptrum fracticalcis]
MNNAKTISHYEDEEQLFFPDSSFSTRANIQNTQIYDSAWVDYKNYWMGEAQKLHWFKPWDKVLEWHSPFAQWFVNGKLNACYNCLDRHLEGWRRNKAAIIFEGELGDRQVWTYQDLHREVTRFANVLRGMGVNKGDTVTIYLPMIPEAVITMLACARIGAPHSVVFGGFSAGALRDRISDAESRVIITADGCWRRGKAIPLKSNVDEAISQCPTVEKVVVVQRTRVEVKMEPVRDVWYHEIMRKTPAGCQCEIMDAEDVLFILYTSGTTGKPKGIVHTTGGYLTGVASTHRNVFDLKEDDVYWCTADIGWITGHSYVVYGPLANGATILIFEGAPDYPGKDRFWEIIEKYRVSIFYTAPTAIRMFMKWGESWPQGRDLSSLRLLGSVGEPINPEAWHWYHKNIGRGRCPVVDTWWQTETGSIMVAPLPGITPVKPGSCTKPLPGVFVDVVDENGKPVVPGGSGYLVIKRPWPSMLRTVYKDPQRYIDTYWSRFAGMYFTGDGAKKDKHGYIWVRGRVDDIINVSGHRIGSAEVESALVEHPAVAEAAVIGRSHELKGQAVTAFVTLREGVIWATELEDDLKNHVAKRIGGLARPEEIIYAGELPKTRSGKIMRRLLRDIAEGRVMGDISTLADPSVISQLLERKIAI